MIQGSSHARTARNSAGQQSRGRGIWMIVIFFPARLGHGSRGGLGRLVSAWTGTALVVPAEREGAAHQDPMAPDGPITPYLVVTPAQRSLRLLVTLLHPVPQAIQPHDLAESGR